LTDRRCNMKQQVLYFFALMGVVFTMGIIEKLIELI